MSNSANQDAASLQDYFYQRATTCWDKAKHHAPSEQKIAILSVATVAVTTMVVYVLTKKQANDDNNNINPITTALNSIKPDLNPTKWAKLCGTGFAINNVWKCLKNPSAPISTVCNSFVDVGKFLFYSLEAGSFYAVSVTASFLDYLRYIDEKPRQNNEQTKPEITAQTAMPEEQEEKVSNKIDESNNIQLNEPDTDPSEIDTTLNDFETNYILETPKEPAEQATSKNLEPIILGQDSLIQLDEDLVTDH